MVSRGLAGYRPIRSLGKGGQGDVLLAFDTRLRRLVAIKVYRVAEGIKHRRRAELEARHLASLHSPQVVPIHDVVAVGRSLALVMAYVPGCNLADLLAAEERLSPAMVVSVAADLAIAFAAARQRLLVHGDLKPENVLLDRAGRALLTDFGIAATEGRYARAASRSALTPEHCRAEPLSQQSDFFALGVLIYRMLYGRHPFRHGSTVDSNRVSAGLSRVPGGPAGLSTEADDAFKNLLLSLLAADPRDRPATTAILRDRLRELRLLLPPPDTLPDKVNLLQRPVQVSADAPTLPLELRHPPWSHRIASSISEHWQRATFGARLSWLSFGAGLLLLPGLYFASPGPCVELEPLYLEASPAVAARLPPIDALEASVASALRDRYRRPQLVGDSSASDSHWILGPQGLRDRCAAGQRIAVALYCENGNCRIELTWDGGRVQRRRQLAVPADNGMLALEQGIEQVLADAG